MCPAAHPSGASLRRATSYALAGLLSAFTAEAAAPFLARILLPHYRRAGWPLRRLLTDGGSGFKGTFDEACQRLRIRHTRTQPRHAWTDGFVTLHSCATLEQPRGVVVSRFVWKREMAHSSGRMNTTHRPSWRTASGGTRHGRAYQHATGCG